ncbi:MAG: YidC/Oxa1 family membrane protein insertase [Actinomycetota bacterium]
MISVAVFQALLDALGWVLSHIYDGIHSYGAAIILLTLGIRLLLLPLGLKQIRNMQAMQAIQPQMKQLQQKYKGNKQKLNEEMMKLYKERGVNPLAGCLPMLLQIPVLIALYSVLRFPQHPPHLPEGSHLRTKIESSIHTKPPGNPANFIGMNLLCNAQQAGSQVTYEDTHEAKNSPEAKVFLDCGSGAPVRIPYYILGLLMVGTMYYQQRQMQRAAPPGQSQQQQMLTRIMPLISIFWGFIVPSGVILYWTTSNLVQIGQQHFLLRAGHLREPLADPGKKDDLASRGSDGGGGRQKAGASRASSGVAPTRRRGLFASMLERAEAERTRRQGQAAPQAKGQPSSEKASSSGKTPSAGKTQQGSKAESPPQRKPTSSGGGNARSRKKRRKR